MFFKMRIANNIDMILKNDIFSTIRENRNLYIVLSSFPIYTFDLLKVLSAN